MTLFRNEHVSIISSTEAATKIITKPIKYADAVETTESYIPRGVTTLGLISFKSGFQITRLLQLLDDVEATNKLASHVYLGICGPETNNCEYLGK